MRHASRSKWAGMFAVTALLAFAVLATTGHSQPMESTPAEPAPPAGQVYTGAKRCSSCHFKQFSSWKKTKHYGAFSDMAEKYQSDAECLKCHATGYGAEGGYAAGTDPQVLENLLGVTCEACHGPGSKHEEICKKYANKKTLDPAEEKEARDSIWKIRPDNICERCHISQTHKEHPKFDKK